MIPSRLATGNASVLDQQDGRRLIAVFGRSQTGRGVLASKEAFELVAFDRLSFDAKDFGQAANPRGGFAHAQIIIEHIEVVLLVAELNEVDREHTGLGRLAAKDSKGPFGTEITDVNENRHGGLFVVQAKLLCGIF